MTYRPLSLQDFSNYKNVSIKEGNNSLCYIMAVQNLISELILRFPDTPKVSLGVENILWHLKLIKLFKNPFDFLKNASSQRVTTGQRCCVTSEESQKGWNNGSKMQESWRTSYDIYYNFNKISYTRLDLPNWLYILSVGIFLFISLCINFLQRHLDVWQEDNRVYTHKEWVNVLWQSKVL